MSWSTEDYYDISVAVGRSRRYHSMMRDFYRRLADWITAISAVSGTSAFVVLFLEDRSTTAAKWLTAAIAIATTLNLVFGFGKKADLHDKLTRQFTTLAAEMEMWDETPENLRRASAERVRIEVDEPHVRRVIDLRAQNDEWRSRGVPQHRLCPLGLLQRSTWLGYFFDFGLAGIEKRMKERDDRLVET